MDTNNKPNPVSSKKAEIQRMSEESHTLIKAFEEKGYTVHIQHDRPVTRLPLIGSIPSRKGGKTMVMIHRTIEKDGKGKRDVSVASYAGIAFCSKKDFFSKKKGVNIALRRAAKAWQQRDVGMYPQV